MKPMYMPAEWLTKEKLVSVLEVGGFPSDRVEISEASPNWECGSGEEDIVKALSSPMWTAKIWEGWSQEEIGRWDGEVRNQLLDQEKKTGVVEMTAWISVARKPS